MRKYMWNFVKVLLKWFIQTLICCIPTALFIFLFNNAPLFNQNTNPNFFASLVSRFILWFFQLNPLYLSIINYRFITKKNAFFIWLFLVALQTPWYFPYIFRETDEWLAIPILISYIGHYQIIGITICFAVACLIKYIIYVIKKKKASVEVQSKDIKENS